MRILNFFIMLVIAYIFVEAINGPNGYKKNLEVKKDLKLAEKSTSYMKNRNKMMLIDIKDLKDNKSYEAVEDLARTNLGMIKPDEVFYRVILPEDE